MEELFNKSTLIVYLQAIKIIKKNSNSLESLSQKKTKVRTFF